MHRSFIFLVTFVVLGAIALAQDKPRRVGEIEFYGSSGFDTIKLRANLPLREGEDFPESTDAMFAMIEKLKEAVKQETGKLPTDVAPVCCDANGDWMIYIGLPGSNTTGPTSNPPPDGRIRLPANILRLYKQTIQASSDAVLKGATADESAGYPLSSDPVLRAKQLAGRAYATRHDHLLRRVLGSSKDARHRTAAAHLLGYAKQSRAQISALVQASRDIDDGVRNNAVRALGVLAGSDPRIADQIPADPFILLLNSGTWTDRNKAGFVLDALSKSRRPRVLEQLRTRALDSLIEMARWRSFGHAYSARVLLGRVAGINETRLQQLVADQQVEQIIRALGETR